MKTRRAKRALLLAVIGMSALCVEPARAALGNDAASALADAANLHATLSSESRPQYNIQEFGVASGIHVREFLNQDGIVFAVSWSGPVLPDLQRLLGAHYAEYAAALAALSHPGLRRSVRVASSGLIVESGGHLRAYTGRAYLPALVPGGVSAAELH